MTFKMHCLLHWSSLQVTSQDGLVLKGVKIINIKKDTKYNVCTGLNSSVNN